MTNTGNPYDAFNSDEPQVNLRKQRRYRKQEEQDAKLQEQIQLELAQREKTIVQQVDALINAHPSAGNYPEFRDFAIEKLTPSETEVRYEILDNRWTIGALLQKIPIWKRSQKSQPSLEAQFDSAFLAFIRMKKLAFVDISVPQWLKEKGDIPCIISNAGIQNVTIRGPLDIGKDLMASCTDGSGPYFQSFGALERCASLRGEEGHVLMECQPKDSKQKVGVVLMRKA